MHVVVILVGIFHDLVQYNPEMHLWVGFVPGKHFATTASTHSAKNLLCPCLPLLWFLMQHVSSVVKAKSQRGKHGKHQAATAGFTSASHDGFVPFEFASATFRLIERFTCIMYNSTTSYDKVNEK